MNIDVLLQWQYLIFLAPFGLSLVFLLLSTMHFGHSGGAHHGHGIGGHGHGGGGAHGHSAPSGHGATPGGGHAHAAASPGATHHLPHLSGHHAAAAHVHVQQGQAASDSADGKGSGRAPDQEGGAGIATGYDTILAITGFDRAPVPILIETFFLIWGFCGYVGTRLLVHVQEPSLLRMAPVIAIAAIGGLFGARAAAEIVGRMMPPEETLAVSHNGLFGATGLIAFAVSETAGRIHIYDEFGTLHDENCRVAAGHLDIPRGRTAMVIDMNAQGVLIVEEVPASCR